MIGRDTDEKDARAYYLSLTKERKKLATRLIKKFDTIENALEQALGQRKINPSLMLFRKIYREIWTK